MSRHYGPQTTGQARPLVDFDAQTEQVHGVWRALWEQRVADAEGKPRPVNRMDTDTINAVIAQDDQLGHLLRWAVADAETMPVTFATIGAKNDALWDAQQRLYAEWLRLNSPVRIVNEQDTTCRHGVPFTDDCDECDA